MKTRIIILLTLCLSAIIVNAQTEAVKVPAEVQPFIEKNSKPIALESADLNGDGTQDYILVLEKENPATDADDFPENQRPLLILVRGKDKKLSEAKRNEKMVMCSQCGGVWGDPFAGVSVGKNTFTVNHYGGSAWRWTADYKFNYSRIDNTWQLVRIEKTSYHNVRPMKETLEQTVLTPPKDFGKVDIADFDPLKFEEYTETKALTAEEIKEQLPEGSVLVHKAIMGEFGSLAADNSKVKYVLLYARKDDSLKKYKIKVVVPAGFEAFDSYNLPDPKYTWSIMNPLAVFFENADADPEKELFVLEQYMTGVGPDGAKYFHRTRVYDWNGKEFMHLESVSEKIGDVNTAAKVRNKLPAILKSQSNNYQKLDVKPFNEKIEKAASANEAWVKMPTQVVANLVEEFSETRSRNIEMTSKFADVTDDLTVIITDDGYADDSVRGVQYKFQLKLNEQGVWKVISAEKAQRCWEGRGHQDYSTAPCI